MNVLNPVGAEAGSRARPTLAAAAVAALVLGSVLLAPTAAPAAVFDELTSYSGGLGYGDFDDPESPCEKPTIHISPRARALRSRITTPALCRRGPGSP